MNPIRQAVVIAAASGVAVASLALPSAASAKTPTTTHTYAAAAGYLANQLVGAHHDHYNGSYLSDGKTITYVNYGESADAILSMDAAGAAQIAAARATTYLETNVTSYAGDSASDYNPGAIGKLMLVAEAQHVHLTNFGGANLIAELHATEGVRGASVGQYQQNSEGTPEDFIYFSTVSQALPVLALASSGPIVGDQDAAAVAYLAAQECADGGYPSALGADAASACAAGEDVDSTAYAAQALIAAGSPAAKPAIAWLVKKENKDGGFGSPSNANSTAIAIEALVAGHRLIRKATVWIEAQQLGCKVKASGRGAVAFTSTKHALDKAQLPTTLLATSQAGVALASKSLTEVDKHGATHATPKLKC